MLELVREILVLVVVVCGGVSWVVVLDLVWLGWLGLLGWGIEEDWLCYLF